MTLAERRRVLLSTQQKKNWFDFSKVTIGAHVNNYANTSGAYGYKDGNKYIANYGVYGVSLLLRDSRTELPKGKYVLAFTVYAPVADGLYYRVYSYKSDKDTPIIANSGLVNTLKSETYTDYALPFSIEEETTVVISLQGVGGASNYRSLNYEFTNIRIEKVG